MSNPSEILRELVEALDATNWSSWQTTAKFMPALEAARIEVAKAERTLEGRPSLEMAPKPCAKCGKPVSEHPGPRGKEHAFVHPTARSETAVQRPADGDREP